uniref:ATP synthase subunit a n=1 Tax=Rhysodes sp. BMNH-844233 TaxID=1909167 RepID=A0A343A4C2_9CARA|nr:ATP synthase F0 subunit 6 [Rhysodes sp. BMNH-844233]
MMTNLFSTFDPTTNYMLSMNWMSVSLGILLISPIYWMIPTRINLLWNSILMTLHKEFKTLVGPKMHKGSTIITVTLFTILLFNNFLGLFPYIFTSSSHLSFTLTLALPMWLSIMLFGWFNNTKHMLTHLVPQGTPPLLMPFMVCIETISNVIRPGTLAVRLAANMIAGHLLLTLLGNTGSNLTMFLPILLLTQMMLMILEMAVSMIQSYVFAILSTLYSSEIN